MRSLRQFRAVGSIALAMFLFAGLPGLASAAGSKANPADPGAPTLTITGRVTALVGGAAIKGVQVYGIGTEIGENTATVLTAADGTYTLAAWDANTYEIYFTDPAAKYLYGTYYASGAGKLSIGSVDRTDVAMSGDNVADINVQLTVGKHVKGKVTGPATPANNLYGIQVDALGSGVSYNAYTNSATDGTYSLTVPAGDFTVSFHGQAFYEQVCWFDGGASSNLSGPCVGAVTVGASDVTGINVRLDFMEGVVLTIWFPLKNSKDLLRFPYSRVKRKRLSSD
jgi:hypothetical protein